MIFFFNCYFFGLLFGDRFSRLIYLILEIFYSSLFILEVCFSYLYELSCFEYELSFEFYSLINDFCSMLFGLFNFIWMFIFCMVKKLFMIKLFLLIFMYGLYWKYYYYYYLIMYYEVR